MSESTPDDGFPTDGGRWRAVLLEGDIGIIAGEITVGRQGAVADGSDTGALVGKAE
jgi:hypothetical protein